MNIHLAIKQAVVVALGFFVETKLFSDLSSACVMEHHQIRDDCREFLLLLLSGHRV
uniref:Uncharacterized protein n=1 Tax=Triticum urartu TaxID=4572 RepID=A0A8R7PR46_TRIUA